MERLQPVLDCTSPKAEWGSLLVAGGGPGAAGSHSDLLTLELRKAGELRELREQGLGGREEPGGSSEGVNIGKEEQGE